MHKKLKQYTLCGIIFTVITGTLMHFVYNWSGNNFLVSLIAPINESTWEHMKLLFFPMLIYNMLGLNKLNKSYPCAISSFSFGTLLGTFLIPVLFYTYTSILGSHFLWIDIAIFIFCIIIAFVSSYYLTINCCLKDYKPLLLFLILIMTLCFFIFTYYQPNFFIFKAP